MLSTVSTQGLGESPRCGEPQVVDVSSYEETWADVEQVRYAAASEVSLLDRLHHARHHHRKISVTSGDARGVGYVHALTRRAIVLEESSGAQSWWALAALDVIAGLSDARGHGRLGPDGRWWRGARRLDVGTRTHVYRGASVPWVGADHLDVQWGGERVSVSWQALVWARSHDAWLYEDAE